MNDMNYSQSRRKILYYRIIMGYIIIISSMYYCSKCGLIIYKRVYNNKLVIEAISSIRAL